MVTTRSQVGGVTRHPTTCQHDLLALNARVPAVQKTSNLEFSEQCIFVVLASSNVPYIRHVYTPIDPSKSDISTVGTSHHYRSTRDHHATHCTRGIVESIGHRASASLTRHEDSRRLAAHATRPPAKAHRIQQRIAPHPHAQSHGITVSRDEVGRLNATTEKCRITKPVPVPPPLASPLQ